MPPTIAGEPRARRTHARRSCDVCKLRKTRCELPDLDVPASSVPLPEDKSCHRCRVLMLPCVVDDSHMKKRKKKSDSASSVISGSASTTSGLTTRTPAKQRQRAASRTSITTGEISPRTLSPEEASLRRSFSRRSSRASRSEEAPIINPIDHTVDISPAFLLSPTRGGSPDDTESSNSTRTVRLHGRPLALLGAMLNVASRKLSNGLPRRVMIADDLDLDRLISPLIRSRLGGGYAQLVVLHPHLQPLNVLFSLNRESPGDISIQLLLASSTYIALQSLPEDMDARRLRDELAPSVAHLANLVLVQQPNSFHAIQALELLSLHAPFAPALPFQLTDPRTVAPSRGLIGVARNISEQLNFDALVNSRIERWENPDFWLWLGIRMSEAQVALEDERPRKPVLLGESRLASAAMINPDNEALWTSSVGMEDPAELLGKLTICDRLARLDELHDYIICLHGVLENTYAIANFNGTVAVVEELQFFCHRLASIDKRHDDVFGLLAMPQSLVSGWLAYRTMRRRWESMKACLSALQTLVALHFLPGSVHAVPNLPLGLNAAQAMHYALNRSNDPNDILYAYSTNSSAAEEIRRCSRLRGELAEQQLQSFIEISHNLFPPHRGLADIMPLHDIFAVTLESAKALMEIQASKITFQQQVYNAVAPMTMPSWVPSLTQVSHILRKLSLLRSDNDDGVSGESISSSCSNLLGSMVNTVQKWMNSLDVESNLAPAVQQPPARHHSTPSASTRSVSPLFPGPRRSSTVGDGPLSVEVNMFPMAPSLPPTSSVSSDSWISDEQQRPMTAPSISGAMSVQYAVSAPSQAMSHIDITPPRVVAPIMTVTPPTGEQRMSSEETPFTAPPAAPTETPTHQLDHLLSEMFGYGLHSPSLQSAPPTAGPVFPPAPAGAGVSPMQGPMSALPQQLLPGESLHTPHQSQQQSQSLAMSQQQQQHQGIAMP